VKSAPPVDDAAARRVLAYWDAAFSAGAGERSALLRAAICARLGQLGIALDDARNAQDAEQIATCGAAVAVLVVRAGEEIVIARETERLLGAA
jgi:acetate kinase